MVGHWSIPLPQTHPSAAKVSTQKVRVCPFLGRSLPHSVGICWHASIPECEWCTENWQSTLQGTLGNLSLLLMQLKAKSPNVVLQERTQFCREVKIKHTFREVKRILLAVTFCLEPRSSSRLHLKDPNWWGGTDLGVTLAGVGKILVTTYETSCLLQHLMAHKHRSSRFSHLYVWMYMTLGKLLWNEYAWTHMMFVSNSRLKTCRHTHTLLLWPQTLLFSCVSSSENQ